MFCGWQPPRPVPRLDFVVGPLAGQTIPLQEDVTTVGRGEGVDISLTDPSVSRLHAEIMKAIEQPKVSMARIRCHEFGNDQ